MLLLELILAVGLIFKPAEVFCCKILKSPLTLVISPERLMPFEPVFVTVILPLLEWFLIVETSEVDVPIVEVITILPLSLAISEPYLTFSVFTKELNNVSAASLLANLPLFPSVVYVPFTPAKIILLLVTVPPKKLASPLATIRPLLVMYCLASFVVLG